MNKKQRDIFKIKIDRLCEVMKNGDQDEISVKDIYAPYVVHFFEIYKLFNQLHIIHYRGDQSFKPTLVPIIERLVYPQHNGRKKLNFRISRRKTVIPDYMRVFPECSQVDLDELFKKLDLMVVEFL